MNRAIVRWCETHGVFLVDFGNARFSATPKAAADLCVALRKALDDIAQGTRP